MALQVSPIGAYNQSLPALNAAPSSNSSPVGGSAYSPDSYQGGGYGYAPSSSGLSIGRMAAWGGGIFAALKWLRPVFSSPSGWLTVGIAAVGWFAGDKLYHMVTGK